VPDDEFAGEAEQIAAVDLAIDDTDREFRLQSWGVFF
jgi:hypothetical protein